jgi:hypothetical protein
MDFESRGWEFESPPGHHFSLRAGMPGRLIGGIWDCGMRIPDWESRTS